jgi:hypothetical protein
MPQAAERYDLLERRHEIDARGCKRRHQTEGDASDKRDHGGEREDQRVRTHVDHDRGWLSALEQCGNR